MGEWLTQAAIARRLGVSRQQVSKRLKAFGVKPGEDGLYDLEQYRGLAQRPSVARERRQKDKAKTAPARQKGKDPPAPAPAPAEKSLEEAKRDDLVAATRLKEIRIAEAESRLIARDLAVDLLAELAQCFLTSIENILETKDECEAAKAQFRADYAAILKRLPRIVARCDAAHPLEGAAGGDGLGEG